VKPRHHTGRVNSPLTARRTSRRKGKGGRRKKRKSYTGNKDIEAYIHVDDRLIGTVDGGEQGVGATGVEGQQRRRVARVWTSVPSVVPCRAQRSCTAVT